MSRIGKQPIEVPKNVVVTFNNSMIQIKGPTGELSHKLSNLLKVTYFDSIIRIEKNTETRVTNQIFGLTRSLIKNMVSGVSTKFEKKLQMIGVGYKAQINGNELTLNVGCTHPIIFTIPLGMEVVIDANTNLTVRGSDKEAVGLLASKIRATRPPEPYKGKGVKYANEIILRKAGKSGKK